MPNTDRKRETSQSPKGMRLLTIPLNIAVSLMLCICACIAVISSRENSMYIDPTPARIAMTAMVILSLLSVLLTLIILKGRKAKSFYPLSRTFSLLPATASLCTAVYTVSFGLGVSWDLAIAALALLASAFFTLRFFGKFKLIELLTSLSVFALGISIIALLYFDFNIELNSTYKLAVQFGAVAMILGTVADARQAMDRISLAWLIALKSAALALSGMTASLTITPFALGNTKLPEFYTVFALMYAAYAVSIAAELVAILLLLAKSDTSVPDDI